MNVLVWGINYSPELIGIAPCNTALCEFLWKRGHSVRMLTSFPYYPAWKKLPGDAGRWHRCDDMDGVVVHRCWHYVPARPTPLKRILHEGSFAVSSLLKALSLPRPDVIIAVSPPLALGLVGWLVGAIRSVPVIFHVQDLQPDAAIGLGMMRPGLCMRLLYALEKLIYRKAAGVSAISQGMLDAIAKKGIGRSKLMLFPNGITIPDRLPAPGEFRRRHGYGSTDCLAVYSGNLGVKQGLEVLVQAAQAVRNPALKLLICGDGAQKDRLATLIADARLGNIRLLPLQSESHYLEMLVDANLTIVTQQQGAAGCFFPSKLLKSLALGRPVVTVCDPAGDLARFSREMGFGPVVAPGDAGSLAATLDQLAGSAALLMQHARAARMAAKEFDQETIHRQFESDLTTVVQRWRAK